MAGKLIKGTRAVLIAAVAALLAWPGAVMGADQLPDYVIEEFGAPPDYPEGALSDALAQAVDVAFIESVTQAVWGPDQTIALGEIAQSGDPRLGWIISDLMRFVWGSEVNAELSRTAESLLGISFKTTNHWGELTDHLIAWNIPAYPDYLTAKRTVFTGFVPGWERIFEEGAIDWRMVSWGGVPIDDRPFDQTDRPCNCIPAADNPLVSSAEEASWLADDAIVFGVVVNGEARAYPRRIMEVREMVNDTLGGRDLGLPYCTLCGAAQAYFTDDLPMGVTRPILRTSGLLIRSNKVMFDLNTYSVFDTFLGKAVTGPLADKGVVLKQAPVVTTTWGDWKAAYPETTVLVEELALGRDFDFRNNRDANGPIFPIGDVDPRLPVHEDVIGVVTKAGQAVAFQRSRAMAALQSGQAVKFDEVQLTLDAGGLKAVGAGGEEYGSHQAFWFAWSQFHPGTRLWGE